MAALNDNLSRFPASILSCGAWILAGIFIFAQSVFGAASTAEGILAASCAVLVGVVAAVFHTKLTRTTETLDFAAVMLMMWVMAGIAASRVHGGFLLATAFGGVIAALCVRKIPRAPIVFVLAAASTIPLQGAFWYVLVFIGLVICWAISHVHNSRRTVDIFHGIWHTGTALLMYFVTIQHLYAL